MDIWGYKYPCSLKAREPIHFQKSFLAAKRGSSSFCIVSRRALVYESSHSLCGLSHHAQFGVVVLRLLFEPSCSVFGVVVLQPGASSGELQRLEDSLNIKENFPDSGVQQESSQNPDLGGFEGFLAQAEESFIGN
ncbi:hypothetical protein Taro_022683 [Colocasia esculenta]|uniref:Uncharacterized protein n=1 Tax=Colocasia esculenta TaxID=4460 RepID=A0A843V617_COLES|nr:hypothetical protein [Colocasia esculenta]